LGVQGTKQRLFKMTFLFYNLIVISLFALIGYFLYRKESKPFKIYLAEKREKEKRMPKAGR